jgi:hypothetical protein
LPRESNILVVANRTALSAGLDEALRARLAEGPATFTLIVPLGRVPDGRQQAETLAAGLRDAGFDVTRAIAGDADPLRAVVEIYSPAEYDEIIVSTLPAWKSRWMKSGLPQRIERHTGALVRHVEARSHHHESAPLAAD